MHCRPVFAFLAAAFVAAVCVPCLGLAAPPPPLVRQPSRPIATLGPAGTMQMAPDVAVTAARVLHFTGGHWAPLPPGVQVPTGQAILLQCDIAVAGPVKANSFNIAWYLDGVKTCGEWYAGLHNAPLCEYTWPLTTGGSPYIANSPGGPGPHTFKCAVDVGGQVSERSEQNNSAEAQFMTFKPATLQVQRRAPLEALPTGKGVVHP